MATILYKITNNINGKIYLGVTRQSFNKRMNEHLYAAKKRYKKNYFYNAVRKYGWDNFKKEILAIVEDCESEDTERRAIKEYNSFAANKSGYNRTLGGGGTVGVEVKEETRKKLSKVSKERMYKKYGLDNKYQQTLFHNKTGSKQTQKTKKKISESLLKAHKEGRVNQFHKLKKEYLDDILKLRDEGLSYKKIAEKYNVTPSAVFYFCKRLSA